MRNPNRAIEIQKKNPVITVKQITTFCDGGNSHLGHPRVYVNLAQGQNKCGYCGQKFNYDKSHSH